MLILKREVVQTVETEAGILHLQFAPTRPDSFCTANSNGTISFYRLEGEGSLSVSEVSVQASVTDDSSTIIHYVQWHPVNPSILSVCLSTGEGLLLFIDESHGIPCENSQRAHQTTKLDSWHLTSHSDQAWTLSFTRDGRQVLTGGDDSVLQRADLWPGAHHEMQLPKPDNGSFVARTGLWAGKMVHGAGVTSILPLTWPVVLTGSYDDHIRILEATDEQPRILAKLDLGGGVWRLNVLEETVDLVELWNDQNVEFLVLASCMYAGTRIVQIRRNLEGRWSMEVVARFEEHESMNYGSDWVASETGTNSRKIVSTSFYDKLVCLWHLPVSNP